MSKTPAPTPTVSVIIPAYNVGHCISLCLDSVFAQELQPAEILVVDDGSTDDTAQVVEGYGSRVTLIRQKNLGQGAARNAGLARATGDCIAFLDADDYWRPPFLRRAVEFLNSHPQTVAVLTAWVRKLDAGREAVVPRAVAAGTLPGGRPLLLPSLFPFWVEHDPMATGAVVIRHATVKLAGPQRADLRNSQDLEYWALIATYGPWGFIPEPLFVCNSRNAAARGWIKKYSTRRRLCPTVESWQERVLPRIAPEDMAAFAIIRGQVAAGFAHMKLLAGKRREALEIVRTYSRTMPAGRLNRVMRGGAALGLPGWFLVSQLLLGWEQFKNLRLRLGH